MAMDFQIKLWIILNLLILSQFKFKGCLYLLINLPLILYKLIIPSLHPVANAFNRNEMYKEFIYKSFIILDYNDHLSSKVILIQTKVIRPILLFHLLLNMISKFINFFCILPNLLYPNFIIFTLLL